MIFYFLGKKIFHPIFWEPDNKSIITFVLEEICVFLILRLTQEHNVVLKQHITIKMSNNIKSLLTSKKVMPVLSQQHDSSAKSVDSVCT